jgi:hypothetical protein
MTDAETEREWAPPALRLYEGVIVTGDDKAERLLCVLIGTGEIGEANVKRSARSRVRLPADGGAGG